MYSHLLVNLSHTTYICHTVCASTCSASTSHSRSLLPIILSRTPCILIIIHPLYIPYMPMYYHSQNAAITRSIYPLHSGYTLHRAYTIHIPHTACSHHTHTVHYSQSLYPSCAAYAHPIPYMHGKSVSINVSCMSYMITRNAVIAKAIESSQTASRSPFLLCSRSPALPRPTIPFAHRSRSHRTDSLPRHTPPKQISRARILHASHTATTSSARAYTHHTHVVYLSDTPDRCTLNTFFFSYRNWKKAQYMQ